MIKIISFEDIRLKNINQLIYLSKKLQIKNYFHLNKYRLLKLIVNKYIEYNNLIIAQGLLEIKRNKYGFLRCYLNNYSANCYDIYISFNIIKKNKLKSGDYLVGEISYMNFYNKYFSMNKIYTVNYITLNKLHKRTNYNNLISIYPNSQIILENNIVKNISCRIIDILSPIGKGQRALIVAPPKSGKTILVKDIAYSISQNYPNIYLIVLLVGERPEEFTDISHSIKGEVISSNFDQSSYKHIQLTELVIEKAKRFVELKRDVVVLLDSITRLARAYNNISLKSGKTLTGGINSNALQRPKKILGSARNILSGGSLTIIATALIDTGSKMDDIIFEEFKATGNSEIVLDRRISEKKIFPSINVIKSGTRKDDLLINKYKFSKILLLKKTLSKMFNINSIQFLINKMKFIKSNVEFLNMIKL